MEEGRKLIVFISQVNINKKLETINRNIMKWLKNDYLRNVVNYDKVVKK